MSAYIFDPAEKGKREDLGLPKSLGDLGQLDLCEPVLPIIPTSRELWIGEETRTSKTMCAQKHVLICVLFFICDVEGRGAAARHPERGS